MNWVRGVGREQGCEISVGDFVLGGRGDGAFGDSVGEAGMAEVELDFACERGPDETVPVDKTPVEGQLGVAKAMMRLLIFVLCEVLLRAWAARDS